MIKQTKEVLKIMEMLNDYPKLEDGCEHCKCVEEVNKEENFILWMEHEDTYKEELMDFFWKYDVYISDTTSEKRLSISEFFWCLFPDYEVGDIIFFDDIKLFWRDVNDGKDE